MKKMVACALACAWIFGTSSIAFADDASDAKAKMEALQAQMNAYKVQMDAMQAQLELLKAQRAAPPPASRQRSTATAGGTPVTLAPGDGVTFLVGNEPITVYGNLDLSYDVTTKGLAPFYASSGDSPAGNNGYLGGISSNLSYIGVRGSHTNGPKLGITYQLETQLDISSTAGTVNTSSNNDSIVKGALTSRNSFIGMGNKYVGAFKLGKTDAPYKTSTARMNPFNGMLGDYGVVMGNSGGDNRVEFGTRLDHSLWYESPNMHGLTVNLLASPGQNRAPDNSLIAAGESSCAGGNVPGSGALPPTCNDGSYGAAYSGSVNYLRGRFYGTAAYEVHKKVNRTSDLASLDPADVGDEDATKFGVQYTIGRRTSLSGIYERMRRMIPAFLQFQNERQRDGFWFAGTQQIGAIDTLSFGWARANPSPGDPGQHNTSGGLNPDNMANMMTLAYRHTIDRHVSWYFDYAVTANHRDAHYDLGAGGRGLTTDCHDGSPLAAFDATTGAVTGNGPHCYAGGLLRGFSSGLNIRF